MYWSDFFYILTLVLFVVSLIMSGMVRRRFKRYAEERTANGMTGAMAADRILRANGITDVTIVQTAGNEFEFIAGAQKAVIDYIVGFVHFAGREFYINDLFKSHGEEIKSYRTVGFHKHFQAFIEQSLCQRRSIFLQCGFSAGDLNKVYITGFDFGNQFSYGAVFAGVFFLSIACIAIAAS